MMTTRTRLFTTLLLLGLLLVNALVIGMSHSRAQSITTTVVDTGQDTCYDDLGLTITCPTEGEPFHGQDAQYDGAQPNYTDNGDGTVTDNNTGLMWQQTPGDKLLFEDGMANADSFELAGYTDWRVPTIKELYSLIDFRGERNTSADDSVPFIDTGYFNFEYGDTSTGDRYVDAQYMSSNEYVSTTMLGDETVFGVNFADGRIKGYPKQIKEFFLLHVRGGDGYGVNSFVDNGDGTITDESTGLMWQQADDGTGRIWEDALAYCEALDLAGYTDWHLPNAKELQGIVDYTRSPDTTNSPAIDPVFSTSSIVDDNGDTNYPYFWTSTSHLQFGTEMTTGDHAVYIAFGEAQGYMEFNGETQLLDVHGAGAQRSDPKTGDPADYAGGFGPQGDIVSIYNYARCVRDVPVEEPTATPTEGPTTEPTEEPTAEPTEEPTVEPTTTVTPTIPITPTVPTTPTTTAEPTTEPTAEPTMPTTPTTTVTPTMPVTPTQDPALSINFEMGSPGSFFIITGRNFPANTAVTVRINGNTITTEATTDDSGIIIFILDTSNADAGRYTVTISIATQVAQATEASVSFELSADAPLREREEDVTGVEVTVPAGIAQSTDGQSVYLPLIAVGNSTTR